MGKRAIPKTFVFSFGLKQRCFCFTKDLRPHRTPRGRTGRHGGAQDATGALRTPRGRTGRHGGAQGQNYLAQSLSCIDRRLVHRRAFPKIRIFLLWINAQTNHSSALSRLTRGKRQGGYFDWPVRDVGRCCTADRSKKHNYHNCGLGTFPHKPLVCENSGSKACGRYARGCSGGSANGVDTVGGNSPRNR